VATHIHTGTDNTQHFNIIRETYQNKTDSPYSSLTGAATDEQPWITHIKAKQEVNQPLWSNDTSEQSRKKCDIGNPLRAEQGQSHAHKLAWCSGS